MIRNTVAMRWENIEFLQRSTKRELRFALCCPETMHGRVPRQSGR